MGNLITETPYSEVTATLELLDRLGVDRDGLKKFRKASSYVHLEVGRLVQEGEGKTISAVSEDPLLTLISGTIFVPAITEKFVARKKFIRTDGLSVERILSFVARLKHKYHLSGKVSRKVKISHLDGRFIDKFLSGDGKIEEMKGEATLRCYEVRPWLRKDPLIAELGGEAMAEITLAEMFTLMERQGNGENGILVGPREPGSSYSDFYIKPNIFFVRGQKGRLEMVTVFWWYSGWDVRLPGSIPWERWENCRVFSRNSVL